LKSKLKSTLSLTWVGSKKESSVRKNLFVLGAIFCFANSAAWSQSASPAATPPNAPTTMPTDPAELMKVAAEMNGLNSDKLAPWHLKATFQLYDTDGKPSEKGTFEEFRAGPHKYKKIYASPSFTQTVWATEDGRYFRTGDTDTPRVILSYVRSQITSPLPTTAVLGASALSKKEVKTGNLKLQCVMLNHLGRGKDPLPAGVFASYCFGLEAPILRLSMPFYKIESVADGIFLFQNRYIPKAIYLTSLEKPILDIRVESLQVLGTEEQSEFKPEAGAAKFQTRQVEGLVPEITQIGKELRKIAPVYPQMAKERRLSGTVVIDAVIGKDGRVKEMTAISSRDPLLTAAAKEAVSRWEYSPFQLDGEPTEASILITVIFNLGS
jgi:TonB family protein